MAEFAMVGATLVVVCLVVLQLALAAYVRATLIDCAGLGARHGALYGSTPEQGAHRAAQAARAALGEQAVADVSATTVAGPDGPVVRVTITASLPLLGLMGPQVLQVHGNAAQETSHGT